MRQDENTAILSRSFGEVAQSTTGSAPVHQMKHSTGCCPRVRATFSSSGWDRILTRLLAERVAHVTAVEPDDRMRAVLAATKRRWKSWPAS